MSHANYAAALMMATICCFISSTASAQQTAGYLGKRQAIELELSLEPISYFSHDNYDLTSGLGIGIGYQRVIQRRRAIGVTANFRSFGKPRLDGRFSGEDGIYSDIASNELVVVAEYSTFGGSNSGGLAPLGAHMTYGLGFARYSGEPRSSLSLRDTEPLETSAVSVVGLIARLEYSYRYIFKDQLTLVPFGRFDLSTGGIVANSQLLGSEERLEELPILPNIWRLGFRVGVNVGLVL